VNTDRSDDDEPDHSDAGFDTRKARAEARDEILLELLADGCTHVEAAQFAGCSARTVQRRLLDDNFSRELARRRSIRFHDTTSRLTTMTSRALTALEDTLEVGSPPLRFRAAESVLKLAWRARDEGETERRLHRLEQQADHHTPEETAPRWNPPSPL